MDDVLFYRITLNYGGRDITRTFSWLLDNLSFPYMDCKPEKNILDSLLLQELKHSYCHMDTVSVATGELNVEWYSPVFEAERERGRDGGRDGGREREREDSNIRFSRYKLIGRARSREKK